MRRAAASPQPAQVVCFKAGSVCEVSYKHKGGKYQNQMGITLPRL